MIPHPWARIAAMPTVVISPTSEVSPLEEEQRRDVDVGDAAGALEGLLVGHVAEVGLAAGGDADRGAHAAGAAEDRGVSGKAFPWQGQLSVGATDAALNRRAWVGGFSNAAEGKRMVEGWRV